jgi:hypothetical protein
MGRWGYLWNEEHVKILENRNVVDTKLVGILLNVKI